VAAARRGLLWRARTRLDEWARLDGRDATGMLVRGLVAAALGDARGADDSWRRLPDDGRAAAWLAGLRGGALRRAFERYNAAVAAVRAGEDERAAAEVEEALAAFPDLLPALRLRGLLEAAAGDAARARSSWTALVERCGDDADALRFLAGLGAPSPVAERGRAAVPGWRRWAPAGVGAALSAAAVLALLVGRGSSAATQPASSPAPAAPAVAFAPRGRGEPATPRNAAERAVAVAPPGPVPPPASPPAAARRPSPVDLDAYRAARTAFAAGDWATVRERLSGAVGGDPGAYFHDDALYLLARAELAAGDPAAARRAAVELLALHPQSIFVNRITRSLVGLKR
jgi:tetratricopeptide (TPR) repeat protein